MKYSKLAFLTVLALQQACTHSPIFVPEPKTDVVQEFLNAFNGKDPAKMAAMVTEDVKWLSIADGTASIEVEGKSNLVTSMTEYFASCPTCRSVVSSMMPSQDRVGVIEVASWQTKKGSKSQQALAIYEFAGSKIKAVYYFPAESVPTSQTRAASKTEPQ